MTITWEGRRPCEHTTRWMPNTKECGDCWSKRWDREMAAREMMPFEAGDEDHKHWDSKIEATRPEKKRKKAS